MDSSQGRKIVVRRHLKQSDQPNPWKTGQKQDKNRKKPTKT
jgi:hypothetical protein